MANPCGGGWGGTSAYKVWQKFFSEASFTDAKTAVEDIIDAAFDVGGSYISDEMEIRVIMNVRADDGSGNEWNYDFALKARAYHESAVNTTLKNNLASLWTEMEDIVTDSGKYSTVERVFGVVAVVPPSMTYIPSGTFSTQVDTLNWAVVNASGPEITHMADDIYVVCHYKNVNGEAHNYLSSVDINTAIGPAQGYVGAAVLDQFDVGYYYYFYEGHVAKFSDSIVFCAHRDNSNRACVDTVEIGPSGMFGGLIDTSTIVNAASFQGRMVKVGPNYFAVPYGRTTGGGLGGFVGIVHISDVGAITVGSPHQITSGSAADPWLCHVRDNIYMFIYRTDSTGGHAATVSIDEDGNVSSLDTLQFRTGSFRYPACVHVHSGYVVVMWEDYDNRDGYLTVIGVDASGNMTKVEDWKFESNQCRGRPFHLGGRIVVASYQGDTGSKGYLKTFEVDGSGSLNETEIDSLTYSTASPSASDVLQIHGPCFAITWGDGSAGSGQIRLETRWIC